MTESKKISLLSESILETRIDSRSEKPNNSKIGENRFSPPTINFPWLKHVAKHTLSRSSSNAHCLEINANLHEEVEYLFTKASFIIKNKSKSDYDLKLLLLTKINDINHNMNIVIRWPCFCVWGQQRLYGYYADGWKPECLNPYLMF